MACNTPLPSRRRAPLRVSEAAYLVDRYGRQSLQTLSTIAGASQASLRRAVPLAEQGALKPLSASRPCRSPDRSGPFQVRSATRSFGEAAGELGLTAEALYAWLVRWRWIRRDSAGVTIAAATRLAAGLLNQPVRQQPVGRRGVRLHYGAIRFTPRGMANLRAQVALTAGEGR